MLLLPKYKAPNPPWPIKLPIRHFFLVKSVNLSPSGSSTILRGFRRFFVAIGALVVAVLRFPEARFLGLMLLTITKYFSFS